MLILFSEDLIFVDTLPTLTLTPSCILLPQHQSLLYLSIYNTLQYFDVLSLYFIGSVRAITHLPTIFHLPTLTYSSLPIGVEVNCTKCFNQDKLNFFHLTWVLNMSTHIYLYIQCSVKFNYCNRGQTLKCTTLINCI